MQGYNKIRLVGYVSIAPRFGKMQTGEAYAILSINCEIDPAKGSDWVTVNVYGKLAELLAKQQCKGRKIFVEGSLKSVSYSVGDNENKYAFVLAKKISFLSSEKSQEKPEKIKEVSDGSHDQR